MRLGTVLFMLVAGTSIASADVDLGRRAPVRSSADPTLAERAAGATDPLAGLTRRAEPSGRPADPLAGLASRAEPMQQAQTLPDLAPPAQTVPDLGPTRPSVPDLAPPAQPSVPDLAPPAERMVPGIGNPAERMLPSLTNAGQAYRMIAVDTGASPFVTSR